MKKRIAAEWEPAIGVMVGYPISLPKALVQEFAKDTVLYLLCENEENVADAKALMMKFGIDPEAVKYLIVPKGDDSTWPRDWGPQPVFDEEGAFHLIGPSYKYSTPFCGPEHDAPLTCAPWLDEPLPLDKYDGDSSDDDAAQAIAEQLGVDFIKLPFAFTGGNVLVDGVNTILSTEVLWLENKFCGWNHDAYFNTVAQITGMTNYAFFSDYEDYSLQHVDCFLKVLDDRRLLIQRPPADHPLSAVYEGIVENEIAKSVNSYGQPWEILRVDTGVLADGEGLAAYVNSIILNTCIYVPQYSIPEDEGALQAWRDAMPGYEVKGFTFVLDDEPDAFNPDDLYDTIGWDPGDVLHCRSRAVWDPDMLYVRASRPFGEIAEGEAYQANATIVAYSGADLLAGKLQLHYRVNGGQWVAVPLQPNAVHETYSATIPGQAAGAAVDYYLEAADASGRTECAPRPAPKGFYSYTVAKADC